MRPSGRSAATKVDPSPRAPASRLRLLVKEDDRRAEGAALETLGAGAVQGAVVGGDDVRVLARDHVARLVIQTGRPQRSGANPAKRVTPGMPFASPSKVVNSHVPLASIWPM